MSTAETTAYYLNAGVFHQLEGDTKIVKLVDGRRVDVTFLRDSRLLGNSRISQRIGCRRENIAQRHEVAFQHSHQEDEQESVAKLIRIKIHSRMTGVALDVDLVQVAVYKVDQRALHDLQLNVRRMSKLEMQAEPSKASSIRDSPGHMVERHLPGVYPARDRRGYQRRRVARFACPARRKIQ